MSPKLTLRFNDDKDEGNDDNKKSIINRGFVIKKNLIEENHKEEVDDNDNKTTDGAPIQHEHKIRNLLSKNFPYNKPKPSNKIGNYINLCDFFVKLK